MLCTEAHGQGLILGDAQSPRELRDPSLSTPGKPEQPEVSSLASEAQDTHSSTKVLLFSTLAPRGKESTALH